MGSLCSHQWASLPSTGVLSCDSQMLSAVPVSPALKPHSSHPLLLPEPDVHPLFPRSLSVLSLKCMATLHGFFVHLLWAFVCVVVYLFVFQDRVMLYDPGWPQIPNRPASASQMLHSCFGIRVAVSLSHKAFFRIHLTGLKGLFMYFCCCCCCC